MANSETQHGYEIDTGKRRRRRIIGGVAALAVLVIAGVLVTQAGGEKAAGGADDTFAGKPLKIGFNSAFASEQELIEYAASEVAPDYGLELEAVPLGDPAQIDQSVSDGILAGTIYEHRYWMQSQIESGGFEVEAVQPIYKWAFAVYSDKHEDIESLPDGATIGVPDDPSNQAQALWLLADEGLITLEDGVEPFEAQLSDVAENPNDYELKPLGLSVMPRALSSLDAGISYVDFFDSADTPADQSILSTPGPEEFDAQLVVGSKYADEPTIDKLEELWADERIQQYLEENASPALFPVDAS